MIKMPPQSLLQPQRIELLSRYPVGRISALDSPSRCVSVIMIASGLVYSNRRARLAFLSTFLPDLVKSELSPFALRTMVLQLLLLLCGRGSEVSELWVLWEELLLKDCAGVEDEGLDGPDLIWSLDVL